MPGLVFFYSADDPSVALEAVRLGYSLLEKKHYAQGEELILLNAASRAELNPFRSFYVLPDEGYISQISLGSETKDGGKYFRFIWDRVGAAAIVLISSAKPADGEVRVGSLEFEARTYRSVDEPLEPRPQVFSRAFRSLRSFIKRSAQPVPNRKFPKTVYVFPQAMALLRQDFSRSPWPSLEIR